MNLYLFLAVFWFVLGLALVLMPWVNPNAVRWDFPGTTVSFGWSLFVLVLYNLMRWNQMRSMARSRTPEQGRPPVRRQRPAGPPPEPDPNFDFTDPPSEPK